ncbi:PQQ-dependent sugar dehydrogenase [Microbacterium sp. SA39]|uniref:PQQ-dependent sugar dehydrogenase n=1 Tax=Microbacterium sp. SA39 TaxID=1263625 RepID=UPI0005FA474A|nr:PQQ-dependent sugar dehydrogenase [Microbacterium sp. SA39]KJQ54720.1 Quinoprotein glucose dehydrogenase B precursor [Microbacterium sp. SA39]
MDVGRKVSAIAGGAALLLALTACASEPPSSGGAPTPARSGSSIVATGEATVIAQNLAVPWSIAFHGDIALFSERDTARIVEVSEDGIVREVGVIDGVAPRGEGGLLGIAVGEGYLYAYFTTSSDNRIERYEISGAAGALRLGEAEAVLSGLDVAGNHNGGRIAFGPDGMLYATVGDAGQPSRAQDLDSLSGKILRLTPDGDVPDDNPIEGSVVFSYGHRNPQGIAWGQDGVLYASEFGQDTWDELNIIEAGGNYGWPEVEGIADRDGFVDPVQQWRPDQASPSGIAVTGGAIFIANLRGERLREVPIEDLTVASEHNVGEFGRLRDVVVAPDGALWMLTNNRDGRGSPSDDDDRVIRVPLDKPE